MTKENQKKYQAYKKAMAKYNKLISQEAKLDTKCQDIAVAFDAAVKKLAAQWQPKINKAGDAHAKAQGVARKAAEELKAMRKAFLAADNPDRAELFKLILD